MDQKSFLQNLYILIMFFVLVVFIIMIFLKIGDHSATAMTTMNLR